MNELTEKIKDLGYRIKDLKSKLDLQAKETELVKLESQMSLPDFWSDQQSAKDISQQSADLKNEIEDWKKLEQEAGDLQDLAEETESDDVAWQKEIEKKYYELKKEFSGLELSVVLNGKYDKHNAVISIYAGAGGDDAQDWAEMLLRMYLRYCENKKWKINILDQSKGGEAGIKSVSFEVMGKNSYGFLKAEAGVHRLVRLSPFDADKARHTSFAMVEVIPEIESETDFKLKDEDLKIEANTATGHGGQSVNTTYSAIRITHLPTGLRVNCQNERSQAQNKETALKILKGKLSRYYEAKVEEERQRLRGEFTEAAWGNQIRSYVLHPYKMVKDHRTDYEESDPDKVLDGSLDGFIQHHLLFNVKSNG